MPITYEIDSTRRLVTTRLWGAVSAEEIYEHNRELRSDPAFDPSYRQCADMTGVTEVTVSTAVINDTALDQFFTPGTRRAFVASDDGVFGMARMYALRAENLGQTIQVFRELGPAKEWLGV
jgi:hypothetical protein